MPEPFKNLLGPQGVRAAAAVLAKHHGTFPKNDFERQALQGLEALEMKARAEHICAALQATLPRPFEQAAALIEASLAQPAPVQGIAAERDASAGLAGWILWPVGEYVAREGLATPERALATLHALTQRFTAEWAIRPFITQHPVVAWATLARWVHDPSEHVRRLVSEGSRPRLPWGAQLRELIEDPSPTLPLLRALQDDTSEYVRRSVANHLNDIAKDHPGVLLRWLRENLSGAGAERKALLRHASRSLIKAGHAEVLDMWGVGAALRGSAVLTLSAHRLRVGESLQLQVRLKSTSPRPQALEVDYAVHHVKAGGSTRPKVFKGWKLSLPARGEVSLSKAHSLREVTTRRYHAGRHRVELLINGKPAAQAEFDLRLAV